MKSEEEKKIIVEKHINMMMETLQILDEDVLVNVNNLNEKPKKKDTRVRNRKEYMKQYYTAHKEDLLTRSKARYTPKKNKNIEIEKIE